MTTTGWARGLLMLGLGGLLIAGCATGLSAQNETPGQHFDRMMKEFAENCAKTKLKPNDRSCDRLKLKPADPLATEEGRFAHSIKIPNPVPLDSGYKPGMTSQEYFDHLCKTEAGEFIYKTVENVEGIYMMRPREQATDYHTGASLRDGGPVWIYEWREQPESSFSSLSRIVINSLRWL